jgi:hypothetical protein
MAVSDNTTTTEATFETDDESTTDTDNGGSSGLYHWIDDNGYEKVGDGESFAYIHQIVACVDNSPWDVFNPRRDVGGPTYYWKEMGHSEGRYDQFRSGDGGEQ